MRDGAKTWVIRERGHNLGWLGYVWGELPTVATQKVAVFFPGKPFPKNSARVPAGNLRPATQFEVTLMDNPGN